MPTGLEGMEKQDLLDEKYWSERYETGSTGWDIGYASFPLTNYIDQLESKTLHILVPGAGNAYEAEYLWQQGFCNVHVMDISKAPLKSLLKRVPDFPESQLVNKNFFDHSGQYDLILEQTFFCALEPGLREDYCLKCRDLLKPGGSIAGVLFNVPLFTDHPPFGGNEGEYRNLFTKYFQIGIMESCHNSIPPRAGNELFIKLTKSKGK